MRASLLVALSIWMAGPLGGQSEGPTAVPVQGPWRLDGALGTPDWLTLSGSYRMRYETLHTPFRAGSTGSDQVIAERLLFDVRADFDRFFLGAELEDSRGRLDDADSPLGTDDVNAAELLRAYFGFRQKDVWRQGDTLEVTAGRVTIDVGSRRLVARHRMRNTIHSFTGVHGTWEGPNGSRVQAFFTLPVNREPGEFDRLARNDVEFDSESFEVRFWGVVASREQLLGRAAGEFYVFGLSEDDRPGVQTRNRRFRTPGFRLFIKPEAGCWDFEVEGGLQRGTSRLTRSVEDVADLDHRAGFVHGEVARTLDAIWSPRLVVEYDYASGDKQPGDEANNRFDMLFGARRSDFGATGIYGAFTRSNISSPGIRVQAKPSKRVSGYLAYRAVFLASSRDAWTTSGLQDPRGASGSFVGHQLETRVRFWLAPGNIRLEFGGAYLIDGPFRRNAPGAPPQGDTAYVYSAATVTF